MSGEIEETEVPEWRIRGRAIALAFGDEQPFIRDYEQSLCEAEAALTTALEHNRRLREALGPFGEIPLFVNSNSTASDGKPFSVASEEAVVAVYISVGDLRRAREAWEAGE
jgi:hypothetical protein